MDAFGVMDLFQISRELVGAKNKSCPGKQLFYQPLLVRHFKSSICLPYLTFLEVSNHLFLLYSMLNMYVRLCMAAYTTWGFK